jgi:hypothetical protein
MSADRSHDLESVTKSWVRWAKRQVVGEEVADEDSETDPDWRAVDLWMTPEW